MEESKDPQQQPLIDLLKDYAELRLKLAKYKAIDGGSSVAASVIADVVVLISAVLAFVFASLTLAFYLGEVFGAVWEGFGCVALIYLIIALAFKYNKAGFEKPIANAIIQKFFKN